MTLFRLGSFRLHSGGASEWKIDMDALDDEDVAVIAMLGRRMLGTGFSEVVGIPRGGLRLAEALTEHESWDDRDPVLVVDDVLTTGASMEDYRKRIEFDHPEGIKIAGLVAFARGPCPPWVKAVFTYNGEG